MASADVVDLCSESDEGEARESSAGAPIAGGAAQGQQKRKADAASAWGKLGLLQAGADKVKKPKPSPFAERLEQAVRAIPLG
jgi:hypothetical protein